MKIKNTKKILIPDNRKVFFTIGLLLIMLSAGLMYQSLKAATLRNIAIVASRDLPSGVVIEDEDLKEVSVDLSGATVKYFTKKDQIIGSSTLNNLYSEELIPISAVGSPKEMRSVAIKLSIGRVPPDLAVNDQVDIWWTDPETNLTQNLLSKINTSQVITDGSGYASTITLVVSISPSQVGPLISAIQSESIDVVKHEN
jgi:hypothetical protein